MERKSMGPTMLVILDGFGYRKETKYNAIHHADTPNFDSWLTTYPHAFLAASGPAVGRPENSIGTSEAGHKTVGAGRVVAEPLTLINQSIADKSFFSNPTLINALKKIKESNKTIHIMGLLSDGLVHSQLDLLYAFIHAAQDAGITKIVIHPFLDGRDAPPKSAVMFLEKLEKKLAQTEAIIGSIHGRFYAMDRDKNFKRTEKSYHVLTTPESKNEFTHWSDALDHYYHQNITDEFIPPTQLNKKGVVQSGDGIIFFNFRPDRARQLTNSFIDTTFLEFKTEPLELSCFITPTSYDQTVKTDVLFDRKPIEQTLKEVLIENGKTVFSIAETEKYAHITYFFNGGKEEVALDGQERILVPSIKAENYINNPEMSAQKITDLVIRSLKDKPADFYLVNYANADMVGHSGNFDATVKAVSFLDTQLKQLFDQLITKMNGTLYITADHGNAEEMFDEKTHQPKTSHTTNPVPFIMIRNNLAGNNQLLSLSGLADIAPFILKEMGVAVPAQMQR